MPHTGLHQNNHTNQIIKYLIVAVDFITLWLMLLFLVDKMPRFEVWDGSMKRVFWLLASFSMLVAEYFFSTVIHQRVVGAHQILRRTTMLVTTQTLLTYLTLRSLNFSSHLGWQLFFMGAVLLATLVCLRFVERWIVKRLRQRGYNTRSITLVGKGKELDRIYQKLVCNPTLGYRMRSIYGTHDSMPIQGTLDDFVSLLPHPEQLVLGNEVYLCVPRRERELIEQTKQVCDIRMVKFYYVPMAEEMLNLQPLFIDDIEVLATYVSPLEELLNKWLKRLTDIVMSIIFLSGTILLLPFVAILIKIQSPGPVFFRQLRTGLNGHDFYCYKFRSMHVNAAADRQQATKDDPRKFPFGDFMRRTSIDELPQFWNVLRGDMSIVGPRPHMLAHTEQYKQIVDKYMVRHFVKPGITGWAQVTGFRGETNELWQMEGRVERDIWYIQHWSLWLDLRIIWLTVKNMLKKDEKAY